MPTPPAHLLAAMLADPDDDAPRLAWADWLDEQGEPGRGRFVRVQCRLADPARYGVSVAAFEAESREADTLRLAHPEWLLPLDPFDPGGPRVTFRRGLPWELACEVPAPRGVVQFLCDNPLLERLTLEPRENAPASVVPALLESLPGVPNLRSLGVPDEVCRDAGRLLLAALARYPRACAAHGAVGVWSGHWRRDLRTAAAASLGRQRDSAERRLLATLLLEREGPERPTFPLGGVDKWLLAALEHGRTPAALDGDVSAWAAVVPRLAEPGRVESATVLLDNTGPSVDWGLFPNLRHLRLSKMRADTLAAARGVLYGCLGVSVLELDFWDAPADGWRAVLEAMPNLALVRTNRLPPHPADAAWLRTGRLRWEGDPEPRAARLTLVGGRDWTLPGPDFLADVETSPGRREWREAGFPFGTAVERLMPGVRLQVEPEPRSTVIRGRDLLAALREWAPYAGEAPLVPQMAVVAGQPALVVDRPVFGGRETLAVCATQRDLYRLRAVSRVGDGVHWPTLFAQATLGPAEDS